MVWQPGRRLIITGLVALVGAIGYDGYRLVVEVRQNRLLADGDSRSLQESDIPLVQYANAYRLQQQGEFDAAFSAYAAIGKTSDQKLQADIKFNLGNLYFQHALALREAGSDDLTMPLIELAKQNYRDLLRANSANWDARYNLELALALAPETDAVDSAAELNPEHSPRALTLSKAREPLP